MLGFIPVALFWWYCTQIKVHYVLSSNIEGEGVLWTSFLMTASWMLCATPAYIVVFKRPEKVSRLVAPLLLVLLSPLFVISAFNSIEQIVCYGAIDHPRLLSWFRAMSGDVVYLLLASVLTWLIGFAAAGVRWRGTRAEPVLGILAMLLVLGYVIFWIWSLNHIRW